MLLEGLVQSLAVARPLVAARLALLFTSENHFTECYTYFSGGIGPDQRPDQSRQGASAIPRVSILGKLALCLVAKIQSLFLVLVLF